MKPVSYEFVSHTVLSGGNQKARVSARDTWFEGTFLKSPNSVGCFGRLFLQFLDQNENRWWVRKLPSFFLRSSACGQMSRKGRVCVTSTSEWKTIFRHIYIFNCESNNSKIVSREESRQIPSDVRAKCHNSRCKITSDRKVCGTWVKITPPQFVGSGLLRICSSIPYLYFRSRVCWLDSKQIQKARFKLEFEWHHIWHVKNEVNNQSKSYIQKVTREITYLSLNSVAWTVISSRSNVFVNSMFSDGACLLGHSHEKLPRHGLEHFKGVMNLDFQVQDAPGGSTSTAQSWLSWGDQGRSHENGDGE
jgi:hypothetical protein